MSTQKGQLSSTRKGWENERLAAFLLSRFSFVSQPLSASDDTGVDFLCTIYSKSLTNKKVEFLRPVTGFAIQVKSSKRDAQARQGTWTEFLVNLELPYFIGVVSQKELSMEVYSAEFLPLLTPKVGLPASFRFKLVEEEIHVTKDKWEQSCGLSPPEILCPHVCTICATDRSEEVEVNSDRILNICRRVRANISSKVSEENLYEFDGDGTPLIMAGPGSVKHFRMNVLKRLAEAFYNLEWAMEYSPKDFSEAEFSAYSALCDELIPKYQPLAGHGALCEYVLERKRKVHAKRRARPR